MSLCLSGEQFSAVSAHSAVQWRIWSGGCFTLASAQFANAQVASLAQSALPIAHCALPTAHWLR
jgi:hypothetical protein